MKKETEIPKGKEIDFEKSNIVFKDKTNEKEKLFHELFQGLQIKSDVEKYPDSVFYFKGDTLMLEIKKSDLWVCYRQIWSIFEEEFDMENFEIQSFIKEMVGKNFKWNGLIPKKSFVIRFARVKKHFKWNGLIPARSLETIKELVEKHFKESNN